MAAGAALPDAVAGLSAAGAGVLLAASGPAAGVALGPAAGEPDFIPASVLELPPLLQAASSRAPIRKLTPATASRGDRLGLMHFLPFDSS